jgi:hypothetical protein
VRDMLDPAPLPEGLSIPAEAWQPTPLPVRLMGLTLLKRLEALEARRHPPPGNSAWTGWGRGAGLTSISGDNKLLII